MKKRIFPLIIALSALAVSGSAAFYSVFGLSKLFAGASLQVIIMAGSLEFAKLVVASLLYQYWDTINKALRLYLSIACFVLILITSGGIYGFLSGAYQTTATQSELLDKSLMVLNQKQVRFQETKEDLTLEKTQINKSIADLRISLSSPTSVSYWDENSQSVITTTSSSTRRALQSELKTTIVDRDNINIKIEAIMDSINKTDMSLLDKEISNEAKSELGPLKYLSQITGKPMNQVVNWFLLLIIFVFDPLAIALVVAANFAFSQLKRKEDDTEEYFDIRNKELERVMAKPTKEVKIEKQDIVMDDMEEVKKYPNTEPIVECEEIDERRMDIIGQNGNDGLHYDKIEPTVEELDKLDSHLNNLKDKIDELYFEDEHFGELHRMTDTTQTLVVDKPEKEKNEKRTLKYRKRK
tara:strand:+ start:969 stop:2201 length:1233 start_codon:yes stop_codon:yes gene_type:complete